MENEEKIEKLRERLKKCGYLGEIDKDLVYFCKQIRKDLRDEKDHVIAITGYPGLGKSQLASVLSLLVDFDYEFWRNILFIPTSKAIKDKYYNLPMFSVMHIDEASRGLHKQKWYDKVQQTVNQLYDTERENHYLCTFLVMPRFQNFTENFRNFRIKYWINIINRGLAVVYIRDEDKDAKDPWHIDENYKKKVKKWRGKRIFERKIDEIVRVEQQTKNYFFYFQIPQIPEDIWKEYQDLKVKSREDMKEEEGSMEVETYKDQVQREKMDRWKQIKELKFKGNTHEEIGAVIGIASQTVRRNLRAMEAWEKMKGDIPSSTTKTTNNIYNNNNNDRNKSILPDLDKIQEL